MSHFIDLNSDLGESFGNYTLGMDSEVLNHVTSANVACGWHAGDPLIMETTVKTGLYDLPTRCVARILQSVRCRVAAYEITWCFL